jgi:glycyl-tRNA synthetase beta chain
MPSDLLLEIGVEELPASFVKGAVDALPGLLTKALAELRLSHGEVAAAGTPRRLAVWANGVADGQPDLADEVVGPPARVAFDAEGKPTRAAVAFAEKSGVTVEALFVKETPKGAYVAAKRLERGVSAVALLPAALERVCGEIPFRKSMRWSDGDTAFGRPVRWLVALSGNTELPVRFAGLVAGRTTYGHRFLSPGPIRIESLAGYHRALRAAHVIVDPAERRNHLLAQLEKESQAAGGTRIDDDFLVEENLSLVEEPHVFLGSFDPAFLALPERVILAVAKGHQRYFGLRGKDGKLLPKYLAVVNTLENPSNVIRGNDRVMRARLSDAKFFYTEDLKVKLSSRRPSLDGIVFHKRLGTVGDKVRRVERLVAELGAHIGLEAKISATALDGAALAKCDLVTLMVGELPELQGEMGRAYAIAQGAAPDVADVIADHYMPRGADDACAPREAGALVAIADRLDTLVGSCAVNVMPTGTADPLALRRAAIGVLKTMLDRGWDVSVPAAVLSAHSGFESVKLDLDAAVTADKLSSFLAQRLRGVLASSLPSDVVDACIAAGHERPVDVVRRAQALAAIDPEVRATVGEVFKRAANIAKDAPPGDLEPPEKVSNDVHSSERALFEAFGKLRRSLEGDTRGDHSENLAAIAQFSPVLAKFFTDVFVMTDDERVRNNRLRLMREIQRTCSTIANFNLLAKAPS